MTSALAGRRVIVTREQPGELAELLAERGADVVHVPLIRTVDPDDGGVERDAALARLADFDWLVVTSGAGAERVGAAAAVHPAVRLGAVGSATARTLSAMAGRPVDVVPSVQRAAALADALDVETDGRPQRILIAQADRAGPELAERLRHAGHAVCTCIAYRTVLVAPDRPRLEGADALALTSGSAVQSWVDAVGPVGPPVIVAIGPVTADVAQGLGLKISSVAADHSLAGLVAELERQLASASS